LLLVSSLINTILAVNDRLACPKITLFHSRAIPNISIEAYLSRILQYAPFQNEVLLIILLYFDRIGGGCKPTQLIINSFNIHRLLITSILVACKFSSDVFYPNVRYARVGGLPLSELNQLELEFLFLSQFELNTTESELQAYGNKL
ncbi:cyclin-related 2, partial [Linnemannia elongata AG-77]